MHKLLLLTVGALLLASCNGAIIPNPNPGTNPPVGGNPPGGTPPTTTTPYIPTAGAAVGSGDGTKEGTVYVSPSADETELLNLVNEVRTKGTLNGVSAIVGSCVEGMFIPLNPLTYNGLYAYAARAHANYTSNVTYDGHYEYRTDSLLFYGRTVGDRVKRTYSEKAGINKEYEGDNSVAYGGELLAAGVNNPLGAVKAWLLSVGHCRAIMNSSVKYIGAGFVEGDLPPSIEDNRGKYTWALIVSQ